MKQKYLYGASIQGIQSFIFETNTLKEIVGASQLIDNINEKEFKDFCQKKTGSYDENNEIINAAGNIKYLFEKREDCEKVVREFSKFISNYAPGITISQAVQVLSDDLQKGINELEQKLKTQRNKAQMPVDIGFMGLKRARKTGGVGAEEKNKKGKFEVFDRGTLAKTNLRDENTLSLFEKFKGEKVKTKEVPFDLEKITGKAENSWLAIIHADGNGLGNVLQNMDQGIKNSHEFKNGDADARNNLQKKVFNTFSKKLKEATEKAAKNAFDKTIPELKDEKDVYPFRPVVLGGDDLTVIIRADLAYDFTKEYLKAFEQETDTHFEELKKYGVTKLTACAGIAYIKDRYPFHYGVHLAESLVKKAKKFSKLKVGKNEQGLVPASLAFYKVMSSFTDELEEMAERTHFAEESNVSFDYGPYLLEEKGEFANVKELDTLLKALKDNKKDNSKGISKLRQWISELYKDKSKATFMLDRIKSINDKFAKQLLLDNPFKERTITKDGKEVRVNFAIYNDLIQLHTFNEMLKTQNNEN